MNLFFRRNKILIINILLIFIFILSLVFYNFNKPNNTQRDVDGLETSIFLTKNGTQLQLNGQPYTFTGVNAYNAATLWGTNAGCGSQIYDSDLNGLFSSLRPNSIVRIWGWQGSMATNITTKQLDWKGLDRVIDYASQSGQRLIISLGDQAGTCDDQLWKDTSWYNGGFMQVNNPTGLTPLSYWDFVQLIVERYKDSPVIAMWELVNEPEASTCAPGYSSADCYSHLSCPDEDEASKSLRYFFDTVGAKVKSIDPNHLIESSVIGNGQCGASYTNYQYIHESPYIDVASYHDYTSPDSPMPGDQWNGLQFRLNQMKSIHKPLIIGESGITGADNNSNCINLSIRRDKIKAKMDAQFPAGVAGYLPWLWTSTNSGLCTYNVPPADPLMTLLRTYPLLEVISIPTPTQAAAPTPEPSFTPAPTSVMPSAPTPVIPDIFPPSIEIKSPITGTTVTLNSEVTITASTSDNFSINKVNFYVNDTPQCEVNIEPYSCKWQVPTRNKATYVIRVTASDQNGNTSSAFSTVTAN